MESGRYSASSLAKKRSPARSNNASAKPYQTKSKRIKSRPPISAMQTAAATPIENHDTKRGSRSSPLSGPRIRLRSSIAGTIESNVIQKWGSVTARPKKMTAAVPKSTARTAIKKTSERSASLNRLTPELDGYFFGWHSPAISAIGSSADSLLTTRNLVTASASCSSPGSADPLHRQGAGACLLHTLRSCLRTIPRGCRLRRRACAWPDGRGTYGRAR